MTETDSRERELAAQRTRLAKIQKWNSTILKERGVVDNALGVIRSRREISLEDRFHPITPATRFVIARGETMGGVGLRTEHFYVTRVEKDEEIWTEKVATRAPSGDNVPRPSPGFSRKDAELVIELTTELDELRRSGTLKDLNYDLDSID